MTEPRWPRPGRHYYCPRKRSTMTPCVITDGPVAYAFRSEVNPSPICVGCEWGPKFTGVPPPADWDQKVAEYLRNERRRQ
jgi:hypothetical protein